MPTAKRIWDLLLTEQLTLNTSSNISKTNQWFEAMHEAALMQGERIFSELLDQHQDRVREERDRAQYAYDARQQAIGRIGLPNVREYRRKRLLADHETRLAQLDAAEAYTPDLNAVLMLRIGEVTSLP